MKIPYLLLAAIPLLNSCKSEDEPEASGTEYIIVNKLGGNGNVSLYNSATRAFTEQYVNFHSESTVNIQGVLKKGNYLFVQSTYPPQLRKIDVTTGTQILRVPSWMFYTPFMDLHNTDIITLSTVDNSKDQYPVNLKIYDENLILKDSIIENGILRLNAAKVVNDRLFYSIVVANVGSVIRVMDLNTKTVLTSLETTKPFIQLVPMNNNQLLVIGVYSYFIIDTQSLEVTNQIDRPLGNNVAYSPKGNVIYDLVSNAQPASIPYTLYKVDVMSNELTLLKFGEAFDTPIIYNEKENVLVTGHLKILSTEGELVNEIETPNPTYAIFIK